MDAAVVDAAFIKEQIDLYEPDLIIACGTGIFYSLEAIYQRSIFAASPHSAYKIYLENGRFKPNIVIRR